MNARKRELLDWKASYPFINNREKGFSAIEDGIKLRSNKINAVAVRKNTYMKMIVFIRNGK